ncbi:MAG: hypothetical protein FJY56_21675 [Betaproteobacteria bacterium]|nr:hypothetical protein [Betaproteobacteria bacterium]
MELIAALSISESHGTVAPAIAATLPGVIGAVVTVCWLTSFALRCPVRSVTIGLTPFAFAGG